MIQFLIALDQLINVSCFFLPGKGWADETISARSWRLRNTQPFTTLRWVIDKLFFLVPNHCEKSFWAEKARAHLPIEERQPVAVASGAVLGRATLTDFNNPSQNKML